MRILGDGVSALVPQSWRSSCGVSSWCWGWMLLCVGRRQFSCYHPQALATTTAISTANAALVPPPSAWAITRISLQYNKRRTSTVPLRRIPFVRNWRHNDDDDYHSYARGRTRMITAYTTTTTTRMVKSLELEDENFTKGMKDPLQLTQRAFNVLANKNKSWQRLGHMVELAIHHSISTSKANIIGGGSDNPPLIINTNNNNRNNNCLNKHIIDKQQKLCAAHTMSSSLSIVDVGTDHGLLAIGLAASGCFREVIGTDISESSLQSGAIKLLQQVHDYRRDHSKKQTQEQSSYFNDNLVEQDHTAVPALPVTFFVADGLKCSAIQRGKADIVCLAGMGVRTMLTILTQKTTVPTGSTTQQEQQSTECYLLDELDCQSIIVQPTNSRPKNLIVLYDQLQKMGWTPTEERISYVSAQFHVSTLFQRFHRGSTDDKAIGHASARPLVVLFDTTAAAQPPATVTISGSAEQPILLLPGEQLDKQLAQCPLLDESVQQQLDVWARYVEHHSTWIRRDGVVAGRFIPDEKRWLQRFATEM